MAVELGTIDADEAGLATDGDAAGTAHASAIDHDGVERNIRGDAIFLGQQTAEFHHDSRTDGKDLVHTLALDHLLNAYGDYTLLAIRPVVSHDDDFVRVLTYLVLEDDKILAASCQHADNTIAGSLQSLDDGQHRSHAHTTAGTDDGAEVLDVSSLAQGTYDIREFVAHVEVAQLGAGVTHLLHHEGDGACLHIGIGNGERHTFALLTDADDDEMTGTPSLGNQGSLDHQLIYFL